MNFFNSDFKEEEENKDSLNCNGTIVPLIEESYKTFLHKTTILYGSSNSGKSVLIKHIMYLLKDKIPNIVVFNPTNKLNGAYNKFVPYLCIHWDFKQETLKKIYDRQREAMEIYNMVSNMNNLHSIFNIIATDNERYMYNEITKVTDGILNSIEYDNLSIAKKKEKTASIKKIQKDNYMKLFNKTIKNKYTNVNLDNVSELSSEQKKIITFLDFNPNLLLIADDCASNVKDWGTSTEINELFFNGRHFYITTLIALQGEALVPPQIRENAFNSIFTTKKCAIAFFSRKTNNFDNKETRLNKQIADFIFQENEVTRSGEIIPNYKKLVYSRDDSKHPLKYIIANEYEEFKFGSDYAYKLSEQIKDKEKKKPVSYATKYFNI